MSAPPFSYVLPAHNAADVLPASVPPLAAALDRLGGGEIIIVENGSSDDTAAVAEQLAAAHSPNVRIGVEKSVKGFGHAVRAGVAVTRGDLVVVTGADVPFGMSDVEAWQAARVQHPAMAYVGSKRHPDSDVEGRPMVRRVLTSSFGLVRRMLLSSTVRDTQGSLLLDGTMGRTVVASTREHGFLVTTEILEILHRAGMPAIEVPVTLPISDHPTTVRLVGDSSDMLFGLRRVSTNAQRVAATLSSSDSCRA